MSAAQAVRILPHVYSAAGIVGRGVVSLPVLAHPGTVRAALAADKHDLTRIANGNQ